MSNLPQVFLSPVPSYILWDPALISDALLTLNRPRYISPRQTDYVPLSCQLHPHFLLLHTLM
jgi:hypothetical protein